MTTTSTATPTATRTARAATATLAAAALATLGACAQGPSAAIVDVLNESTTTVGVVAWLENDPAPEQEEEQTLQGGGVARFSLEYPDKDARPGVSIRVRPTQGRDLRPYADTLEPPGPYFVRIRGNQDQLTLFRDLSTDLPQNLIPPDPRREGFIDDIPPVNPSFPTSTP